MADNYLSAFIETARLLNAPASWAQQIETLALLNPVEAVEASVTAILRSEEAHAFRRAALEIALHHIPAASERNRAAAITAAQVVAIHAEAGSWIESEAARLWTANVLEVQREDPRFGRIAAQIAASYAPLNGALHEAARKLREELEP